tara:strand:- start:992 stop:1543 length:552 start_codon:yes stop_codon:yes gene_type:complete
MKKSIITLAIIASTLSGAAIARDGAYISASYSNMSHSSLLGGSTDIENGYALSAGYDFVVGSMFVLGTEVEYKNLGAITEEEMGIKLKNAMTSYGVNILPKIYFGDNFNMFAKLGYHKINAEFSTNVQVPADVDTKASDSATVMGLGFGYDFTENFSAQTTYEIHNIAVYNTASANVGLKYKF